MMNLTSFRLNALGVISLLLLTLSVGTFLLLQKIEDGTIFVICVFIGFAANSILSAIIFFAIRNNIQTRSLILKLIGSVFPAALLFAMPILFHAAYGRCGEFGICSCSGQIDQFAFAAFILALIGYSALLIQQERRAK